MSLLARLRISTSAVKQHRLYTPTAVAHFSSSSTRRAEPNPVEADPFFYKILDQSPTPVVDLPPAAPPTGYPKPKPAQRNPIKEQRLRADAGSRQEVTRPGFGQPYRIYVKATRNNIIITFTRPNGDPIRTHSGGACGFKHVNRSTHEAAHQCAVRMFKTIQEDVLPKEPLMKLHVYMSGFGKGRDAVRQAFLGTEGDALRPLVVNLTDKTPIKIGGNRAKKARRI